MKSYLALTFPSNTVNQPVLKEWKLREGTSIQVGDAIFIYGEGSHQKLFTSQATGTFKAFLIKEGEALIPGCMVGVLQVEDAEAKRCEDAGLGHPLTPEEAKGGMSYAEAASIRLPPESKDPM